MTLYALDPGTEQSALVRLGPDGITGYVLPNADLLTRLRNGTGRDITHLVIEQVESYGMPVGREVFETVFWSGRFAEAWDRFSVSATWSMLPRKAVKLALCGSLKAKDPNIRQAIVDRYGGKDVAIGTKRKPGPLYGIRSHLWSALALAITYQESQR